jgi:hypothetical protein
MTINQIGRNTKPEYKRAISRTVRIQGTPGRYTGQSDARLAAALARLRSGAQ